MRIFGILILAFCVCLGFSKAFSENSSDSGKSAKKVASGDPEEGKVLFAAKCSVCHSPDSKEMRVGPGLRGAKDRKLPSGRNATHDVILDQLNRCGRVLLMTVNGYGMPIFRDLLSEKEKEDIIAYILTL